MLSKQAMIDGTPANIRARKMIAMDVLNALDGKKFIAKNQRGFVVVPKDLALRIKNSPQSSLKGMLPKDEACEVCAMGALFVAMVRRYDQLKCEELLPEMARIPRRIGYDLDFYDLDFHGNIIQAKLELIFGGNIRKIETVFERQDGENADTKLKSVMHNILFNKGYFLPSNQPPDNWKPRRAKIKPAPASNCLKE